MVSYMSMARYLNYVSFLFTTAEIRSMGAHRPRSRLAGRRIDSEMGVGKNWSSDSAESLRKVDASSLESSSTVWLSMANGRRNSSREGLMVSLNSRLWFSVFSVSESFASHTPTTAYPRNRRKWAKKSLIKNMQSKAEPKMLWKTSRWRTLFFALRRRKLRRRHS